MFPEKLDIVSCPNTLTHIHVALSVKSVTKVCFIAASWENAPQSRKFSNPHRGIQKLILPPSTQHILLAMDFALQPHLYRHVPVLFWPWLWWQLFRLSLWIETTGRDVIYAVDRYGRVHIRHVADDPDRWSPNAYPHAHERYLTARLRGESRDQWRARIEAVYAPGFGVQAWLISLCALGAVVAQVCRPERPTIRDPVPWRPNSADTRVDGCPKTALSTCLG